MANRNFLSQRIFNQHVMQVQLDAQVSIGASGAPSIQSGSGSGIKSITRQAAGNYRIQLEDNYAKLLGIQASMQAPVSGADVAVTALTPGVIYQITSLGTTTQAQFVTAGVPSGITAAVGVVFKAAATSLGTGAAKILGASGVSSVEQIGQSVNMLNNQPFSNRSGGFVDIRCLDASQAPVDPAAGSVLSICIRLSNSSVQ